VARANRAGLKLTARQIFEQQTVAGLAAVASDATRITAEQGLVQGEAPLTPIQHWFFGLGFDEVRESNILLVDDDLNVLEGEGMANPANRFHLWIYRARPETNAIVHTHPPHASALSMIAEELIVSHMDTCVLYENCAYLPEWPGVPIGDEEGEIISTALGDKSAVLLAHHGLPGA